MGNQQQPKVNSTKSSLVNQQSYWSYIQHPYGPKAVVSSKSLWTIMTPRQLYHQKALGQEFTEVSPLNLP